MVAAVAEAELAAGVVVVVVAAADVAAVEVVALHHMESDSRHDPSLGRHDPLA